MAIKNLSDLIPFLIEQQISNGCCNSLLIKDKLFKFDSDKLSDSEYKLDFILNLYKSNYDFKILDIKSQNFKTFFLRIFKTDDNLDEKFKTLAIFFVLKLPFSTLSILDNIQKLHKINEDEKIKILEFYFKNYTLDSNKFSFKNCTDKFLKLIEQSNHKDKYVNCFKIFLEKNWDIMSFDELNELKISIRTFFNIKHWSYFFYVDKKYIDQPLVSKKEVNLISININSLSILANNPFFIDISDTNQFILNSFNILKSFSNQIKVEEMFITGEDFSNKTIYFSSLENFDNDKTIKLIQEFIQFMIDKAIDKNQLNITLNREEFDIFINNFELSYSLINNKKQSLKLKI